MDWREHAICRDAPDPDLWFPVGDSGPALLQVAEAKEICRHCPAAAACLAYALETNQSDGVWGGMTVGERHAQQRRNAGTRQRAQQQPGPKQDPRRPLVQDGRVMAAPHTHLGRSHWGNRPKVHVAGVDGRSMCGTTAELNLGHARPATEVGVGEQCRNGGCRKTFVREVLREALVAAGIRAALPGEISGA
jgi:WhiB family redox-sensing transcriptional regulator